MVVTKRKKPINKYYSEIAKEIELVFNAVDSRAIDRFISRLVSHKKIYIAGVGRSGLVVKAFGQRLMHLGFNVHLADEITSPAVTKGDLLICCSGTGNTQLTNFMARRGVSVGTYTVTFTANVRSSLAKSSNLVIKVPAPLEKGPSKGKLKTIQPARSLFEQVLYLLFDSIVLKLIDIMGISARKVSKRHANLE